jgi:hypothetical protein
MCGLTAATVKKTTMADAIALNGRVLPINANAELGQGCFVEVLQQIDGQLAAMLSHHSRVMVLRLDLHLYDYTDANGEVSRFVRKVKKRLCRRYGFSRVGHVWAREIEKAKQQHYHIALFLDGNTVQHPAQVIRLCEEIWQGWGHPKPYTPENCFSVIGRNDARGYGEAFYRLSYLAKLRGKGYKAKAANDYSASRIACKQQEGNRHGAI